MIIIGVSSLLFLWLLWVAPILWKYGFVCEGQTTSYINNQTAPPITTNVTLEKGDILNIEWDGKCKLIKEWRWENT